MSGILKLLQKLGIKSKDDLIAYLTNTKDAKITDLLPDHAIASASADRQIPGTALRLYSRRPLFDKGIVHYDTSGGSAMLDIIPGLKYSRSGEFIPEERVADLLNRSRIKVGDLRDIPEDRARVKMYDAWEFGKEGADYRDGSFEFYQNAHEGVVDPTTYDLPTPSVRDVINDDALRRAFNFSLAAPADSSFHRRAIILKKRGGLVQMKECDCGR